MKHQLRLSEAGEVKVALIGCGAVAQQIHLPALKRAGVQTSVVADTDRDRADKMAQTFGIEHVVRDHREVAAFATAAIVATPHAAHCKVSCDLLALGLDVLVEKPMASSTAECDQMIETASASGRVLEVGLMRRYLAMAKWVRGLITSGQVRPIEFHLAEGYRFEWPVANTAFFNRVNGGVLLDTGAHALDLVSMLFGELSVAQYYDDGYGGVEADCRIELRTPSGVAGVVELSRTRDMRNTLLVTTDLGVIEMDIYGKALVLPPELRRARVDGISRRRIPSQTISQLFDSQLQAWMKAILHRARSSFGPDDARRSVAMMEECTSMRQHLALPWDVVPNTAA